MSLHFSLRVVCTFKGSCFPRAYFILFYSHLQDFCHFIYILYKFPLVFSRYFWDVVLGFPLDLQKKLLHFTTGSDRVPVGGMADLNFKISKNETSTNW